MERRNLLVGLVTLAIGMFILAGSASAHRLSHMRTTPSGAPAPETCVITVEPGSFMDQGEFAEASSIATFIGVECEPIYAEQSVKLSATELYDRCNKHLKWSFPPVTGPSFTVKLDNDGNGGAVVFGGPSCAAGESLISAHLETAPYTTVTTAFTVLPPRPTTPGVTAEPAVTVASEESGEVGTIVEVEFPPVYAEQSVNINAAQLLARCLVPPRLLWVGPNGTPLAAGAEELSEVKLDNDGNAFVVLLGAFSCASGTSLIEASLERAPYTTYTTEFTILPPFPTFP